MTPDQRARAAAQQAQAIAAFEAEHPELAVRHTELPYIRAAATARATREVRHGPGPDRPRVHGAG